MPIFVGMKSFVVLLANGISDYAVHPLADGGTVPFLAALKNAELFPDHAGTIITCTPEKSSSLKHYCDAHGMPKVQVIPIQEHTARAFFTALIPLVPEVDHIFIGWADAPFLDSKGAQRLYEQHCKYKAEYSFADGYPEGLLPHILAAGLVSILAALPIAEEVPLCRTFLFDTVKKDINSYDLETMIAPDDVRHLRLAFFADTKASHLLCKQFSGITCENYAAFIADRQESLRLLPAYYNLEITAYHPLHSLYRPAVFPEIFSPSCCMDFERADALIDAIADFSETAVISLSLYGEPLLHPRFLDIVTKILENPNLSVLIETCGIGDVVDRISPYIEHLAETIHMLPMRQNGMLPLYWIIDIDAVGSKMYGTVHRIPEEQAEQYLKQAATFADRLAKLFPHAVWVQMTRMNENETELESFYRLWEKRAAQPLIQKYDHLCGALPDRRPADIAPLKRHPCWHLKRDLSVCKDGTVPLCKDDYKCSVVLGNVFTMPLEVVWENGQRIYCGQVQGCYKGVCEHCDEYYTYNF